MSEDLVKINPCDICGDPAIYEEQVNFLGPITGYRVCCSGECANYGPIKPTPEEAIAAWNTRAAPSGEVE